MAPEKESNNTDLKKLIKNPLFWGMLVSLLGLIGTNLKDVFLTGTEAKHNEIIVNIVTTDRDVDDHFRGIVKDEIASVMDDATTWLKVLDNDYLKDYTEDQVNELTADIDRRIAQIDSAQHNLINDIGKMAGIRNDEFVKIFSSMIREYKKDHIDVVHASF